MEMSLVLACYNEEPLLAQSVDELVSLLKMTHLTWEIIFVDDASTDATVQVIEAIRKRHPDLPMRLIRHPVNLGRGRTVTDGFQAAQGRVVGYLDVDLEVHARYLLSMWAAIEVEHYDAAVAWRIYKLSLGVLLRALCSKGYHGLVRWVLGLPFKDTEAGFKFFKREPLMRILRQTHDPSWFWDTEIMAHAWLQGLRVKEIPCLFIRRRDKKSSVRLLRDVWRYGVALVQFKRRWLRCPSQTSLLYRVPWLYHQAMRLLYRQGKRQRLAVTAQYVPAGTTVLDVCSGDCALYSHWLRGRLVDYLGVDINPRLLYAGARQGARVRLMDVHQEDLPPADIVVMQASLYQFIPNHHALLQKLLRTARRRVIVTEPVKNWAASSRQWIRQASQWWTNPGTGPAPHRFTREELEQLFLQYGASEIKETSGGRDLLGVFHVNSNNPA